MPEVYTKDKNGNFKKLGNVDTSNLLSTVNEKELDSYLKEFWNETKCGKHPELAKKHKDILKITMIAHPKDLFEQLNSNRFNFSNFGPLNLHNFLKDSKLDSYLKPEYIGKCLDVHTSQPDIGKGEFLLVSCFKNINFNLESGDLIDDEGRRIEVKGVHSSLGGNSDKFKMMNSSLMFSLYRIFNTNGDSKSLTMENISNLEQILKENKEKQKPVMLLLQNRKQEDNNLANAMVELFNEKGNLLKVIAASHLYNYLKVQNANFLFAINTDKMIFSGFSTPKDLNHAYSLLDNFTINGWATGNTGISISLKKG